MGTYTAEQLWKWAVGLPEQLAVSPPGLDAVDAPLTPSRRILVCGMGGSGVSAQFLSALGPFVPWRWAGAPEWLSSDDALIAVSHSGDTFETLTTVRDALARGAKVYGVTSGGELARMLDAHDAYRVAVPEGMPPRSAFGYLLGACLRLGGLLIGRGLWSADEVLTVLTKRRDEIEIDDFSRLRPLAGSLAERRLAVYGTCPLSAAAALRWKQQLNENAKQDCSWGALPEISHNEIEAAGPGETPRRIVLKLGKEAPPLDSLIGDGESSVVMTGPPGSPVFRALYLVLLGDLLSLLIALERGVNPGDIPRISGFKRTGWARRYYGGGRE